MAADDLDTQVLEAPLEVVAETFTKFGTQMCDSGSDCVAKRTVCQMFTATNLHSGFFNTLLRHNCDIAVM